MMVPYLAKLGTEQASKAKSRKESIPQLMGFHQKSRRNLEFGKAVHWGPQHKNNLSDATCVSDKNGKSPHFSKIVPLKEDFAIAVFGSLELII